MDDFIDLFAATIPNRDFSGLTTGWLLSTYSSNRANPRSLFRDVALRRRFPGLAAGWFLPCCDMDAQIVPGEVHRIQHTGLSAGWLLSLGEKGEQFLVVKLATFDYTSYFLNLLTVALRFLPYPAKVRVSQFLSSANCFTRFAKVHGLSLLTSPFCPVDPPSWLPLMNCWGFVFVFCQHFLTLFCCFTTFYWIFWFTFKSLSRQGFNWTQGPNHWSHSYWRHSCLFIGIFDIHCRSNLTVSYNPHRIITKLIPITYLLLPSFKSFHIYSINTCTKLVVTTREISPLSMLFRSLVLP